MHPLAGSQRDTGLSQLCALDATPAELIELAHAHGSDSLGALRVGTTRIRVPEAALHLARSGGSPGELRSIGTCRLPYLQVKDSMNDSASADLSEALAEALAEAVSDRRHLREGRLTLPGLLREVPDVPVSVEAPTPVGMDTDVWAARLAQSTGHLLNRHVADTSPIDQSTPDTFGATTGRTTP